MYFCLVVALLSTFLWINITVGEYLTIKANPYAKSPEDEKAQSKSAKIKLALVTIMALFWGAVIMYI